MAGGRARVLGPSWGGWRPSWSGWGRAGVVGGRAGVVGGELEGLGASWRGWRPSWGGGSRPSRPNSGGGEATTSVAVSMTNYAPG